MPKPYFKNALALTLVVSSGFLASAATAASQETIAAVERGHQFARTYCATCHSIGPAGDSPLQEAPPFRSLHNNYPVEQLGELFVEGVASPHSAMPDFHLDQDQSNDMVAYITSLE